MEKVLVYKYGVTRMRQRQCRLLARQKQLLCKHFGYYRQLDFARRLPASDVEEHFVAACRGRVEPATEHEIAYLKLKKILEAQGLTVGLIEAVGSESLPVTEHSVRKPSEKPRLRKIPTSSDAGCWACNGEGRVGPRQSQLLRCSECKGTGRIRCASTEAYEQFGKQMSEAPPGFIYRDDRYGNRMRNF